MPASKTIRSQLISKIGQRPMYTRIDKVKETALHSITTEIAMYVVASQEKIPVPKILMKEKKMDKLKDYQDAVKNFDFGNGKAKRRVSQTETTSQVDTNIVRKSRQTVIEKIVSIGKKYGIENIDEKWIDALAILNFIETASTKFLMDHDYIEKDVKSMKWEEKLTKLQNKMFEEASSKEYPLRTSVGTFFKNYRQVRNDQDHIAHLPTSNITKDEIDILQKHLNSFIKTVFVEHKKYCLKLNDSYD